MLQYKIPQNVGIEDRIVGPLTLRQLIILVVGFGISYVFFAILSKLYELNILEYIIIAIPAVVSAAVALIKINDIRLPKFILMFLEFSIKPKKRLWDHRGIASLVAPDLTEMEKKAPKDALEQKVKKTANLNDLTQVLDSGGFEHLETIDHKEIDEVHDDDLMAQVYFGHKDSSTGNMYWRTKESHKKMLDLFAKLPVTKLKKGSKEAAIAQKEIAKAKYEAEEAKAEKQKSAPVQPAPAVKKKPRKRKRKVPQPVRKNNIINTTGKNTPAKFIPKPSPKPQNAQKPEANLPRAEKPKKDEKGGEFKFEELKKGEIEINLD